MKPMAERIKSAIDTLDSLYPLHMDDWDDTLLFNSIIAVMIPFVPIDIRDKVEELI